MRFSDFIDPERGPAALVRLALYPLFLVAALETCRVISSQLRAIDILLLFLFFTCVSPLAYLIREARRSRSQRHVNRRGAERTPLLPPDEEEE